MTTVCRTNTAVLSRFNSPTLSRQCTSGSFLLQKNLSEKARYGSRRNLPSTFCDSNQPQSNKPHTWSHSTDRQMRVTARERWHRQELDKCTHLEVWQRFINPSVRSKSRWCELLTAQRSGATWIPHGCIFTSSPSQHTPVDTNRTHTIFLYSSFYLLSAIHPHPPGQPAFLPLADCLKSLSNKATHYTACLSLPSLFKLSPQVRKQKFLGKQLLRCHMTSSLRPRPPSLTPPPPLSTYNSSAICR